MPIYGSYRKIKTGVLLFGPMWYNYAQWLFYTVFQKVTISIILGLEVNQFS